MSNNSILLIDKTLSGATTLNDNLKHVSGIFQLYHQLNECSTRPFLRWVWAQGHSPVVPKMPWAPEKGCFRHQAINLTPPRRLEVCPVMWHTWPDPCHWHHGRLKCVPSSGFSWLKSALKHVNRHFENLYLSSAKFNYQQSFSPIKRCSSSEIHS